MRSRPKTASQLDRNLHCLKNRLHRIPVARCPQKRAVEIDHGIAIVPQATVVQEVKQGTLAAISFKGKEFTRPLAILHRKGRVLTPAMKKFIEILNVEPQAAG